MFVAFIFTAALGGSPVVVAAAPERCNGNVAQALTARASAMEAHPVSAAESGKRIDAAQGLLADIGQESEIDRAACATDETLAPVMRQLHAAAALAYAAQADAAMAKFSKDCPAGAARIGAAFVAGAWLELAQGVGADGRVPGVLSPIVPKIRARAAAVKLTLPDWADTSNYWKTTIQEQGHQAILDCRK